MTQSVIIDLILEKIYFMKKKILIIIIIIISVIQFIPVDKTNPPVDSQKDYFSIVNLPENVKNILKKSCFDCHSNETVYPWYSNVAPISWFLKNHINEGREHVNFSEWGNYSAEKQKNIVEDCAEEISENEMPLSTYTLLHSDAKLDKEKLQILSLWFGNKDVNEEDDD